MDKGKETSVFVRSSLLLELSYEDQCEGIELKVYHIFVVIFFSLVLLII